MLNDTRNSNGTRDHVTNSALVGRSSLSSVSLLSLCRWVVRSHHTYTTAHLNLQVTGDATCIDSLLLSKYSTHPISCVIWSAFAQQQASVL